MSSNVLLGVSLFLLASVSCSKDDSSKNPLGSKQELTSVNVLFNNNLPDEVRKHLTKYHLEMRPINNLCTSDQLPTAINEKGDWPEGKGLRLQYKIARGCEYNLRFKLGEILDSREIWYLSNYKTEDGDEQEVEGLAFKTIHRTANPMVEVCLTHNGIEANLGRYIACLKSSLLSEVEIEVDFAGEFSFY